jgi:hypothetical protein
VGGSSDAGKEPWILRRKLYDPGDYHISAMKKVRESVDLDQVLSSIDASPDYATLSLKYMWR